MNTMLFGRARCGRRAKYCATLKRPMPAFSSTILGPSEWVLQIRNSSLGLPKLAPGRIPHTVLVDTCLISASRRTVTGTAFPDALPAEDHTEDPGLRRVSDVGRKDDRCDRHGRKKERFGVESAFVVSPFHPVNTCRERVR